MDHLTYPTASRTASPIANSQGVYASGFCCDSHSYRLVFTAPEKQQCRRVPPVQPVPSQHDGPQRGSLAIGEHNVNISVEYARQSVAHRRKTNGCGNGLISVHVEGCGTVPRQPIRKLMNEPYSNGHATTFSFTLNAIADILERFCFREAYRANT